MLQEVEHASGFDVEARTGWLLQQTRLHAADPAARSQAGFAAAAARSGNQLSSAAVSLLEHGHRPPTVLDVAVFETVSGRPAGSLRGPIDQVRRTFGRAPLPWCRRGQRLPDIQERSEDARAAFGETPTGHDWLRLADHLTAPDGPRPFTWTLQPRLDALIREFCRSTGGAFSTRREALVRLLESDYAPLLRRRILDFVETPDCQATADLVDVVTEHPTSETTALVCRFALSREPARVSSGLLGMANTLVSGTPGAETDRDLISRTTARLRAEELTDAQRGWLRMLHQHLQPQPTPTSQDASGAPASTRRDGAGSRARHPVIARMARAVAEAPGVEVDPGPILQRVLADAVLGPPMIAYNACALLAVSPCVTFLAAQMATTADTATPQLARRIGDALVQLAPPTVPPEAAGWLDHPDPALVTTALRLYGESGTPADPARLLRLARDPRFRRHALYAAGMSGSPVLDDLAVDGPARSAVLWWSRLGTVVRR